MAITLIGVRLTRVLVDVGTDKEISGNYELMSSTDTVVAKQSFNGYDNIHVDMSKETKEALKAFKQGLKADINTVLGL